MQVPRDAPARLVAAGLDIDGDDDTGLMARHHQLADKQAAAEVEGKHLLALAHKYFAEECASLS
jgi:hypothetical protein